MSRSTPPELRFMAKVQVDAATGCWVWKGETPSNGYGRFKAGGRRVLSHRWAYEHWVGTIPAGLVIDHLCRRHGCVNPAHLEAVTQQTNLLRGNTLQAANAAKTRCLRDHEFTAENTYVTSQGLRHCRACQRIRDKGRRDRKRTGVAA